MDTIAILLTPVLFLFVGLFSRRYNTAARLLIMTIIVAVLLFLYLK